MKTSRFLGLVALATLTLGSCSNDEVVNNDYSQDNAIEFSTYMGRGVQSRAQELTDDNLKDFGVFASYTGQSDWPENPSSPFNFMYNQKVARTITPSETEGEKPTVGDWEYSPLKYWPTTKGDKISFFAYAPYSENAKCIAIVGDKTKTGAPQIKYTIDANKLTEAEDFVADVLYNQTKSASTDPDGSERTVSFTLNHELTRIAFEVMLDETVYTSATDDAHQTQVNIKKIEFGGTSFPLEATYSFARENDSEASEGNEPEVKRGTWTINEEKNGSLNIDGLLTKTTLQVGEYEEEGIQLKDNKPVTLFSGTEGDLGYLFLIPPVGEAGLTDNDDVTLTIEYDIVTEDKALSAGHSCTPTVKEIKLPAAALKQGVAYKYVLTFYLNKIVLEASVAEWVEDEEEEVEDDVDWNDKDVTIASSN